MSVNDNKRTQPAAAQEAVARQTMATCPRDGTVVLLHWGEDHVSPGWWSAPCAPVQNSDGTWPSDTGGFPWAFFDLRDGTAFVNHAVDTAYGPTHWSTYTAPVAAAPVDLHAAGLLHVLGATDFADASRIVGNMLAQASTPAAPGIDLPAMPVTTDREPDDSMPAGYFESNLDWARRPENIEALEWFIENHEAIRRLIDASPKGGSEHVPDELPAFLRWCADELVKRDNRAGSFAPGLAESLRGRAIILEHVAAMQATSTEVGA